LVLLACTSLLAVTASSDESRWQLFRPVDGGFEVEFLGEPEHRFREEGSILGRVLHRHYWVDRAGARLDVERHDLPRIATFLFSTNRLLDRVRHDLMKDLGTDIESEEGISLQGYPGRRVLYSRGEPTPLPEETRFYLAGSTLFVVAAGVYAPRAREPIVDRFFASFRIIESDLQE